jgi:hypothetical protein
MFFKVQWPVWKGSWPVTRVEKGGRLDDQDRGGPIWDETWRGERKDSGWCPGFSPMLEVGVQVVKLELSCSPSSIQPGPASHPAVHLTLQPEANKGTAHPPPITTSVSHPIPAVLTPQLSSWLPSWPPFCYKGASKEENKRGYSELRSLSASPKPLARR